MLYCLGVMLKISRKNVYNVPKNSAESFLSEVYCLKIISLKIFLVKVPEFIVSMTQIKYLICILNFTQNVKFCGDLIQT